MLELAEQKKHHKHHQWRRNKLETGGRGAYVRREAPEKKFFFATRALLLFLALQVQLVVLASRFRHG